MLPFATTSVTVKKPSESQSFSEPGFDGYYSQLDVEVTGIRACITNPRGSETSSDLRRSYSGEQAKVGAKLYCDLFDGKLEYKDAIVDDSTGETYEVVSMPFKRVGAGIDYWVCEILQIEGLR
jgi:hypothetical protein